MFVIELCNTVTPRVSLHSSDLARFFGLAFFGAGLGAGFGDRLTTLPVFPDKRSSVAASLCSSHPSLRSSLYDLASAIRKILKFHGGFPLGSRGSRFGFWLCFLFLVLRQLGNNNRNEKINLLI